MNSMLIAVGMLLAMTTSVAAGEKSPVGGETIRSPRTNTPRPELRRGQKAAPLSPIPLTKADAPKFKQGTFTFVRIKYSGVRPRQPGWATDYPDSELNFSARFQHETGLKADQKVLELTNAELKQYPFAYIAEGGSMGLTDAEAKGLREYLLGGGFLMADDFWGEAEWENLRAQVKRAFPEREPIELPLEHPIFHSFYHMQEKPQVPSIHFALSNRNTGVTWERADAKEPHYRGLLDDSGRLMAIFCHNTDLGDGWEREGEHEYYFKEFSLKKAYPMGINIVVHALGR